MKYDREMMDEFEAAGYRPEEIIGKTVIIHAAASAIERNGVVALAKIKGMRVKTTTGFWLC